MTDEFPVDASERSSYSVVVVIVTGSGHRRVARPVRDGHSLRKPRTTGEGVVAIGLAEPVSPLWTAVKAIYNPWPPDDEGTAQQLAQAWNRAATTTVRTAEQATGIGGSVLNAWSDTNGSNLNFKVGAHATKLADLSTRMGEQAGAADTYAVALATAKSAIHDTIAANEPTYTMLSNPLLGAVGGAGRFGFILKIAKLLWDLIKKIADWLRKLVASKKPKLGPGVRTIDRIPLKTPLSQLEAKYKHAKDFGINDPRGRPAFDKFGEAVRKLVDDEATIHIDGLYRGKPAILNYNPVTRQVVVQSHDGTFISGWAPSEGHIFNMLQYGKLGGG